ncbi:hypothetical protein [Pseudoalteromonas tetraodonis]|uniref:hypothetical protein n=1 Tax=Pseudoalteromonas tetraodonis TaxID=43659 RepID=UPI000849C7B3|nr:hypothetical protein [Pseudoalteromonas tetraodonis]ODS14287.1 hypothetical protein BCD66_10275 [Pseudoalteromonas tetraodonis]
MQDLVYKYGQRVISFLIVITLLVNWEMFSIIGAAGLTLANNLLIVIWIILLFTSAIGLYLKTNWGFFFFYPGVLLTTIAFSIPLIPFVISVFAFELRPWIMIGINSMLLMFALWTH